MKITIEQTATGWRAEMDQGGMNPSHVTVENIDLAGLLGKILAQFDPAETLAIEPPESDAPPPAEPVLPVQAEAVDAGASDTKPKRKRKAS